LRLVELHRNAGRESVSSLENPLDGIAILSGGTDGEDGPTDAAGAIGDADVYREMLAAAAMPEDYLTRNDAYHFFERVNGLLKTGPTHTNVCDLRVVVTSR
jgi:glycerate 2-kinase